MYKSTVLALYNNNYNIYSFVIKMLSQVSQHNRKHVTHGMGVFVMQQKFQLTKLWVSAPSC